MAVPGGGTPTAWRGSGYACFACGLREAEARSGEPPPPPASEGSGTSTRTRRSILLAAGRLVVALLPPFVAAAADDAPVPLAPPLRGVPRAVARLSAAASLAVIASSTSPCSNVSHAAAPAKSGGGIGGAIDAPTMLASDFMSTQPASGTVAGSTCQSSADAGGGFGLSPWTSACSTAAGDRRIANNRCVYAGSTFLLGLLPAAAPPTAVAAGAPYSPLSRLLKASCSRLLRRRYAWSTCSGAPSGTPTSASTCRTSSPSAGRRSMPTAPPLAASRCADSTVKYWPKRCACFCCSCSRTASASKASRALISASKAAATDAVSDATF